ncbi:Multicopper oxidase mco [Seminavis robusta]|uniref:Multicopper oxidase mco n=1 Tax=Seminavis robusta TaxID=568900 RepID=A0A9N8EFC5_9STRA|nr:Multicopper oxidase mco [Seminavis robusta]|eukprot:Sro996_g229270.1 Multicopper oxidase mco (744) ;mRNA; f:15057-17288
MMCRQRWLLVATFLSMVSSWNVAAEQNTLRGGPSNQNLVDQEEAGFWDRFLLASSTSMAAPIPPGTDSVEPPLTVSFPTPFDPQPTLTSSNGKLEVTLHMGPTGEAFGTPNFVSTQAEGGGFEANVLGYSGCYSNGERCQDSSIQMGGPTLRVKPGDDLIIHLYNDMPAEKCKTSGNIGFWNEFHQAPNTNLHVHGLFVPNSENNVLDVILPGESETYNIHIREVQQGGTHWYHPHAEGSVGIQAGGGAIGFLIVEDLEDDIPPEIASLPEISMRIQHTDWAYQSGCPVAANDWSDNGDCHVDDTDKDNYAKDYVNACKTVCSQPDANCGCQDPETECAEPIFGVPAYKGTLSQVLTVNGAEKPTFELYAGQWYHIRTVYAPTYKKPIEPTLKGCDFKLLSKDGRYMPITPRDIKSGYMFSGSRADFLVRCMEPGRYDFESINTIPSTYNWATWNGSASALEEPHQQTLYQKLSAYAGTMATFRVKEAPNNWKPEVSEIRPFQPARPCYAPEMRNLEVDDSYYFLQSALVPPDDVLTEDGEMYPVFRGKSPPFDQATHGSFYAIQNINQTDTGFPGRLKPPKDVCSGKVTNEYGECYGHPILGQDFTFNIGDIVEVDYYAPQIHPLHIHVFGYQITRLPEFSVATDYFQVGDYHDNLVVPISGSFTDREAASNPREPPEYGKVVFRQHIYALETDVVVHCHFYRHSDRGMVALGNTKGAVGASSPQVEGTCYHGLDNRNYAYV